VEYGHFTAMQVRDGATRGLGLHLARLDAANRELFDTPLRGEAVRDGIRDAVRYHPDASVRVLAERHGFHVTVRPPAPAPPSPQRLMAVEYQRPVAHLKHSGGFGQIYYGIGSADPTKVNPNRVHGLLVVSNDRIDKSTYRLRRLIATSTKIDSVGHSMTIFRR
jgi:hypothetical protein